jgi:hypothetical protein
MADLYSVGGNGTLSVEIENVSIGNLRAMPQFNINNQFRNNVVTSLINDITNATTDVIGALRSSLPSDGKLGTSLGGIVEGGTGVVSSLATMSGHSLGGAGFVTRQVWDGASGNYWRTTVSTRLSPQQYGNLLSQSKDNPSKILEYIMPNKPESKQLANLIGAVASLSRLSSWVDSHGDIFGVESHARRVKTLIQEIAIAPTDIDNLVDDFMKKSNTTDTEENLNEAVRDLLYTDEDKKQEDIESDADRSIVSFDAKEIIKAKATVLVQDILIFIDNQVGKIADKISTLTANILSSVSIKHPLGVSAESFKFLYGGKEVPIIPKPKAGGISENSKYNKQQLFIENMSINPSEATTDYLLPQWYDMEFQLTSQMTVVKDGMEL